MPIRKKPGTIFFSSIRERSDTTVLVSPERSVTELRAELKRAGSPRQQNLMEYLDNPATFERDYDMIVL